MTRLPQLRNRGFSVGFVGVLMCILSGCYAKRDLSSPSKRLVGHWVTSLGYNAYYSEPDPQTKQGAIVSVNKDGTQDRSSYKVTDEDVAGERVVYTVTLPDGFAHSFTSFIPKDGQTRRLVNGVYDEPPPSGPRRPNILTYVDAKTQP